MKVAVAVIVDEAGRILITRRPPQASHGGMWEFPGGKLEEGETATEALAREIREEVGLTVSEPEFLGEIVHSYDSKMVCLQVYLVNRFTGKAICCEAQPDLRWVSLTELGDFEFPAANDRIIGFIEKVFAQQVKVVA